MAIFLISVFLGVDLDSLQKVLTALGNPWIAGRTAVSELSDEEKQNLCGTMSAYGFELDKFQIQSLSPDEPQNDGSKPPFAWDWRSYNGHNWMTPVKNQEGCGNCIVFATIGGFEARIKIANNIPDSNVDLSEEFATCCDKRNFGCSGGQLCVSARFMVEKGVPDERCFPYPVPGRVLPCINACPDWEERAVKAKKWGATLNVQEYKAQIMQGPIACWLSPKGDFFYYKGGVYTPIMGDKYIHAVTLCGWSDSLEAWLFKNSWGTSWGDSGYGWINYGEEHIVGPALPVWLEIEPYKTNPSKLSHILQPNVVLYQKVYPNPFIQKIVIRVWGLGVGEKEKAEIKIYNVGGRVIRNLPIPNPQSPITKIVWDGTDELGKRLPPGVYFLRLKSDGNEGDQSISVKKVILLQ